MRFSKHQRAPNLHSPLNLEHKSLQDVYRVTQSEPIRASYRPVEFALFKKNTSEGTRGSRGRKRKRLREKERVDVCESILNKCSPPSRDFPKKQCCCVLTSFPQLCCVFLITCVQRLKSLHDRLLTKTVAQRYVRALCVGLGRARTIGLIFFFL